MKRIEFESSLEQVMCPLTAAVVKMSDGHLPCLTSVKTPSLRAEFIVQRENHSSLQWKMNLPVSVLHFARACRRPTIHYMPWHFAIILSGGGRSGGVGRRVHKIVQNGLQT